MPIYYVDTYEGSDSNTGASWAQAWKSCYPLKALYSGVTDVQDLEVRFAKTVPMQADCTLRALSSSPTQTFVTKREGRRERYVKMSPGGDNANMPGPEYTSFTVAAGGTYEYAATLTYHVSLMEILASQPFDTTRLEWLWYTDTASSLTATLRLYDASSPSYDPAVDTPFQTIAMPAPLTKDTRRVQGVDGFLAGKPAGCTRVGWKYTIINTGGTPSTVTMLHALPTYALDNPDYDGFCTIFVPNSRFGLPFTPAEWRYTNYIGEGGAGQYRATTFVGTPYSNAPAEAMAHAGYAADATWSVYRWVPWEYSRSLALLGEALTAGTYANPLRISGGWDTTTNTVTGRTTLDAKNIQWFSSAITSVAIDIRHIAIAGNEVPPDGILYTSLMTTAPALSLRVLKGYAEDVHIPNPCSGSVFGSFSGDYYARAQAEGTYPTKTTALLYHTVTSPRAPVVIKNCSCGIGYIFGGYKDAEEVSGSVFLGGIEYYGALPAITNCTFLNVVSHPSVLQARIRWGTQAPTPLYNCDVIYHYTSENTLWDSMVYADMENCRLWGNRTGPASYLFTAKDLTYYTTGYDASQTVCKSITYTFDEDTQTWGNSRSSVVSYDGLTVVHTPGTLAPEFLFDALGVTLSNSTISVASALLPPPPSHPKPFTYNATTAELRNVTLICSAPAGPVAQRVVGSNIQLQGPWTSLCGPSIPDVTVDGLVLTDPGTRIFSENSRLLGTLAAHTATHVVGVQSPNDNLDYLIGTPATSYLPNGTVGGTGFYPYQPRTPAGSMFISTNHGEIWASNFLAVRKVLTGALRGRWRVLLRSPCGAIQVASFPIGVVPVVAGVTLTLKVTVRRLSTDVLCGIFVRPNQTRSWVGGVDTAETDVLQDIVEWQDHAQPSGTDEVLEITYTPVRDGLVGLHAGCRGVTGSLAYFSDFEVA